MIKLLEFLIFIVIGLILILLLSLLDGYLVFYLKDSLVTLLTKADPNIIDYVKVGLNFGFIFYIGISQYKFLSNIKFNWGNRNGWIR